MGWINLWLWPGLLSFLCPQHPSECHTQRTCLTHLCWGCAFMNKLTVFSCSVIVQKWMLHLIAMGAISLVVWLRDLICSRWRGNLGVVLERRPQCAVSHEVRRRGQWASRGAPGKSGPHASGEGERVKESPIALKESLYKHSNREIEQRNPKWNFYYH